jgi:hypothetical protein
MLKLTSDRAVYQLVHAAKIPYHKWGNKKLVFFEHELTEFLLALPGLSVQQAMARITTTKPDPQGDARTPTVPPVMANETEGGEL